MILEKLYYGKDTYKYNKKNKIIKQISICFFYLLSIISTYLINCSINRTCLIKMKKIDRQIDDFMIGY